MTGSVVRRWKTRIIGGLVLHDERPLTFAFADRIAGRRLDRRKHYAIIKGQVCSLVRYTQRCSGCSDEFCDDRGAGCRECGYNGVVRHAIWMADDGSEPR